MVKTEKELTKPPKKGSYCIFVPAIVLDSMCRIKKEDNNKILSTDLLRIV